MIIDGIRIAQEREQKLKILVRPGIKLAILVFKGDRAGEVYSRLKTEAAKRLGIEVVKSSDPAVLPAWSQDVSIQGIMIQRPGFKGEEWEKQWQKMVNQIPQEKDVDGLRDDSKFIQATVRAVEVILQSLPPRGGNVVVVGRGMVGRKLAERYQVLEFSSKDQNLEEKIKSADILISATGRHNLIKAGMVKPGAVVIDVGWPRGDVDFKTVKDVAGWITPVPGGAGPISVICLLENLVKAVYNR